MCRGLDNAGKSTVVAQWLHEEITTIAPTFGFQIKTLTYASAAVTESVQLHFWDIGGQRTIRTYWRNYFEETDGLVFVIDSAAPTRLQESLEELSQLLGQDRLAHASVLILANKQDCQGALSVEDIKRVLPLDQVLGGKTHWKLFGCSAVDGANLTEALDWLTGDISARLYHHHHPVNSS